MIRIVIVDDHPAIRRLLRQLFAQQPEMHIVAEASSGEEALAHVREFNPDVITLDMMLGDMNGLEVIERLKKHRKPPKVVVISLYNTPGLVAHALENGADAYIPKKELNPPRLIQTIERLMGGEA